jgi:hypothetical protein
MPQLKVLVYAVEALLADQVVEDAWGTSFNQAPRRENARWVAHGRLESNSKVHVTVPIMENEASNLSERLQRTGEPAEQNLSEKPIKVWIGET